VCVLRGKRGGFCNTFSSIRPLMMADSEAKGAEFEKKADKKLSGWAVFGSKYDDAAELLEKAANSYKLAKSWDKAANAYIKLANCQLKVSLLPLCIRRFCDLGCPPLFRFRVHKGYCFYLQIAVLIV
jgi:hypothetical protein